MNFNLNLQNAQKLGNYMQPGQYSVKVKTSKVKILKWSPSICYYIHSQRRRRLHSLR